MSITALYKQRICANPDCVCISFFKSADYWFFVPHRNTGIAWIGYRHVTCHFFLKTETIQVKTCNNEFSIWTSLNILFCYKLTQITLHLPFCHFNTLTHFNRQNASNHILSDANIPTQSSWQIRQNVSTEEYLYRNCVVPVKYSLKSSIIEIDWIKW